MPSTSRATGPDELQWYKKECDLLEKINADLRWDMKALVARIGTLEEEREHLRRALGAVAEGGK